MVFAARDFSSGVQRALSLRKAMFRALDDGRRSDEAIMQARCDLFVVTEPHAWFEKI